MATWRDEIKWLETEFQKGIDFLFGYFKERKEDNQQDNVESLVEFGPWNALKVLLVIVITIILAIQLSLFQSEWGIVVVIGIFLLLYNLVNPKEDTTPILISVVTWVWDLIKGIVTGILSIFSSFGAEKKE